MSADLGAVFDQGAEATTCYAHVAADLLTQNMRKRKLLAAKDRIHPLSVSGLYLLNDSRSPYLASRNIVATPGWAFNALEVKDKEGYRICTEAELEVSSNLNHPLFRKSAAAENEVFRAHIGRITSMGSCDLNDAGSTQLASLSDDVGVITSRIWIDELKATCGLHIPSIQTDGVYFPEKGKILKENRQSAWSFSALQEPWEHINKALESGSIAGIEFQASFLKKDKKSLMHWASVVSRKSVNGDCHYKIRNSEGAGCDQYSPKFRCEGGSVWVPEQDLLKHISAVTYLK